MGNELRYTYGSNVLADRAINKLVANQDYVIDSIRHPCEVERLAKVLDRTFILVGIDTPDELRFQHMKQRLRPGDTFTTAADRLLPLENQERANPNTFGQQLDQVMRMAQVIIRNDGTLDEFLEKIQQFYEGYLNRPSSSPI